MPPARLACGGNPSAFSQSDTTKPVRLLKWPNIPVLWRFLVLFWQLTTQKTGASKLKFRSKRNKTARKQTLLSDSILGPWAATELLFRDWWIFLAKRVRWWCKVLKCWPDPRCKQTSWRSVELTTNLVLGNKHTVGPSETEPPQSVSARIVRSNNVSRLESVRIFHGFHRACSVTVSPGLRRGNSEE